MGKNIVFCADGTCNGPQEVDDQGLPDGTNVFKLFMRLKGDPTPETICIPSEQESQETAADGTVLQVAKYIDGVGDSNNPILKLFGGAAGVGLVVRIVRGYTFISRNYRPGDSIFLTGFSRGAYTARALAGLILHAGLLDPATYNPDDKTSAYRLGAGAWYAYQQTVATPQDTLAAWNKFLLDLPCFFTQAPSHYVTDVPLQAIGVWDTVSSYGFSAAYDATGARGDLLPLADADLNPRVAYGFQALSIDEQRMVFVPRLWKLRAGVVQRLFPGAHADVGLHVGGQGKFAESPDPAGIAHQPWRYPQWVALGTKLRDEFAERADLEIDPSVRARCRAAAVIFDPGAPNAVPPLPPVVGPYAPTNLPMPRS